MSLFKTMLVLAVLAALCPKAQAAEGSLAQLRALAGPGRAADAPPPVSGAPIVPDTALPKLDPAVLAARFAAFPAAEKDEVLTITRRMFARQTSKDPAVISDVLDGRLEGLPEAGRIEPIAQGLAVFPLSILRKLDASGVAIQPVQAGSAGLKAWYSPVRKTLLLNEATLERNGVAALAEMVHAVDDALQDDDLGREPVIYFKSQVDRGLAAIHRGYLERAEAGLRARGADPAAARRDALVWSLQGFREARDTGLGDARVIEYLMDGGILYLFSAESRAFLRVVDPAMHDYVAGFLAEAAAS